MEISESEGRKILGQYKTALINNINESPVALSALRPIRTLYYQVQKEQLLSGEDLIQQLTHINKLQEHEQKLTLLRLITQLPLKFKARIIDIHENDILTLISSEDYNFEYMAVINDLLLSTYLMIRYNQELYGATINRIIFLYQRMMELSIGKEYLRNLFEVIRTLTAKLQHFMQDQLLTKLAASIESRAEEFLNQILFFEARLRIRLLAGFCRLIVRTKVITIEFITRLEDSIVEVISKISESECLVDGIWCISILLWQIPHPPYVYNRLLKACCDGLIQASFRREYLEVVVEVLTLNSSANNRLKYETSLRYLDISRVFQSQYTRLVVMKLCIKNLLQISKKKNGRVETILMSLFHQQWFVTRLKEENTLFREEFLISLISEYFEEGADEVKDILDICHRLLDWNCNMKIEANIQTIKYTFDLYLMFLKSVNNKLGAEINSYLHEIMARINSQNINFLFKMKILTLLAGILTYEQLTQQLKTDFIEGELKPFMMPRHPKLIFTTEYALTQEGIIESSKEVEYIRNILNLLTILPNYYPEVAVAIDNLIIEYRDYLTVLEAINDSNKELISVLLELSDEPSITDVSRNLLLAVYQKTPEIPLLNSPNTFSYQLLNSSQSSILPIHSPTELMIEPHCFQSNRFLFSLRTVQRLPITASIRISSGKEVIDTEFDNGIHEIEVTPMGIIDFQVVSEIGSVLGMGRYQLKVDWGWKRVDWLGIADPIRLKVAWKSNGLTASFLSVYWNEPLCLKFEENSTQLCLCVCSKDILEILTLDLQNQLDFLTNGRLVLMI